MTRLLTANELLRGDVLWWKGDGWSRALADAVPVEEVAAQTIIAREAAAERVSDLALIDAEPVAGGFRPLKIRERIRGYGPTVRPDLALSQQDWR
ncbi:DUF2849 domain-containing protein [Sandaracinobacteroides sp. A072]|uniref:DUF2849 domain-containing protein n=1 Tax=Sandaracinobacteroides sp. A072 TaxID=3461146 RepID=UPI0040431905